MSHAGWDLDDGSNADQPPLGVPPRHILVERAEAAGVNADTYVRAAIDHALARGWRPTPGQQADLHIDADGRETFSSMKVDAEGVIVEVNGLEPERRPPAAGALPMRRRTPPSKPLPPQPRRAEPLPIRFARQVLAMDPSPAPGDGTFEDGEWQRLDMPVSRSIISKKCREFADAYGVKLRIRVDHVDPDDSTSPLKPHLWCCILKPEEIDTPLGGSA